MTDATGKKIEFILILLALMVLVLLSKKLEKYASGEIVKLAEKEKKSQVIVLEVIRERSEYMKKKRKRLIWRLL